MYTMNLFHILISLVASVSAHSGHGGDSLNFTALATQLSPNASIVFPEDPLFDLVQQRWQAYSRPTYSLIVQAATEQDVKTTVVFANKHSLPFLAVGGAHGATSSLGQLQGGIAISLANLKGISLSATGDYADMQPGLTNGELIRYLWPRGKQTVTGNCMCTGVTGIMLGGGHGFLQGLYGLMTDQILEARVVLSNGRQVVASPKSNPDLFWAIRGAGHNFGIVTGLKYKVYDAIPQWTIATIILTQDKLEQVFEVANTLIPVENHPPQLVFTYRLIRLPFIDPNNASILIYVIYGGPSAELASHLAPFLALGPANVTTLADIAYPDVFNGRGDESSPNTCAKGWYRTVAGNYLKRFNTTAIRQVHAVFTNITTKYPDIAGRSIYVFEEYGYQGVTAVPSDSTAFPSRAYPILGAPFWGYIDASYSSDLIRASKEIRKILLAGDGATKLHSYVNYASGDETASENYGGDDPWRLNKLKDLKQRYDSKGRFSFYAPIDVGRGHQRG
ncbi:FAD-binding domain-containing protein [Cladorrhinum sp. PSN332]|nr:FAD-binding domain-containing protein [Cladorrhinum sp. PSN332]